MTIISTLLNQKTHIIYGILIILIASVAYHFFKKDPQIIAKTLHEVQSKVQTVEKVVTKDRVVYRDRVVVTIDKKPTGEIVTTTETDHEHSDTVSQKNVESVAKTNTKIDEKTVESFIKNYSIETMYPMSVSLNPPTNPLDAQVVAGIRIFSSPVWLQVGTTGHLNTVLLGVRLEF